MEESTNLSDRMNFEFVKKETSSSIGNMFTFPDPDKAESPDMYSDRDTRAGHEHAR